MIEGLHSGGERRRGFVRVDTQERAPPRNIAAIGQLRVVPSQEAIESRHIHIRHCEREPHDLQTGDGIANDGCFIQCGRWKVRVASIAGIVLVYVVVSMSVTLLDKLIITGLGFTAPLTLISLTYLMMHLVSLSIRARLRRQGVVEGEGSGVKYLLIQRLSWRHWAWKVFPVAAASGLEVGTSALGLQVMLVGVHTMIRSTVPIFVLLFSVGMGLQEFRCGLVMVVFLVSGGVALLFSGQTNDSREDFPMDGFLLTLLSGMLAGLKWTLSQVLLQGRGLYGRGALAVGEHIHPFALLHYMSLSSAVTLMPFALALERGALREMAVTFSGQRILKTWSVIVVVSLLALVLVFTEFSFIKRVSSLSLCIIGVVKELLLVMFSVFVLGEQLSGRTGLGFLVTMVGVILYKLVAKGQPRVQHELPLKSRGRDGTTYSRLQEKQPSDMTQDGQDKGNEHEGRREWQRGQQGYSGRLLPPAVAASAVEAASGSGGDVAVTVACTTAGLDLATVSAVAVGDSVEEEESRDTSTPDFGLVANDGVAPDGGLGGILEAAR